MPTAERPRLTVENLKRSAEEFALFVGTARGKAILKKLKKRDGKSIGSHIETEFLNFLQERFDFVRGNAGKGVDIPDPDIMVDIKTTSSSKPQSSSPVTSVEQKIYGLGHSLLIFIYHSHSVAGKGTVNFDFKDVLFIDQSLTGDRKVTKALLNILSQAQADGSAEESGRLSLIEDVFAYLEDRNIYTTPEENMALAERICESPPRQGQLAVTSALQWRLSFAPALKAAQSASNIDGLSSLMPVIRP